MDPGRAFYVNTRLVQLLGIEPDVVDKIAKSIFECRQVSVGYEKFEGERIWTIVEPWSVQFSDSGDYLYGRCVNCERTDYTDRPRLFNLARVEMPRILDQRFAYPLPEAHDPRRLFENSFGIFLPPSPDHPAERVIVRFAPSWNRYLMRHKLHPAQKEPTVLDDGYIEVVLRQHVTYVLVRWDCGHGKEVEFVGPKLLAAGLRLGKVVISTRPTARMRSEAGSLRRMVPRPRPQPLHRPPAPPSIPIEHLGEADGRRVVCVPHHGFRYELEPVARLDQSE